MKYFLDTEFHEYSKQPTVCGIKVGKPIDTIELISIGIVSEDFGCNRDTDNDGNCDIHPNGCNSKEYYAICKDFDLKAAWDNEWLKENVLLPIYFELLDKEIDKRNRLGILHLDLEKGYSNLKYLLSVYGKSKAQIAEEIIEFTQPELNPNKGKFLGKPYQYEKDIFLFDQSKIEVYAYYADYDWVVFCWLFGRMIDLPNGFPMYCKDLKQELDEVLKNKPKSYFISQLNKFHDCPINDDLGKATNWNFERRLEFIKMLSTYPKANNEHNALDDAKWNKELYKFITKL